MDCVACGKALTLLVESSEEDEDENIAGASTANSGSYVNDDVQLQCGCHFHWQCLLDAYSMSECPKCERSLITLANSGEQQLLCTLQNEGGLQEALDILPILTEETYLKAYPEERKCRAFLEFCGEGDVEAIVDLLQDGDKYVEDPSSGRREELRIAILRYQDHMGSMGSGLHIAIQNERIEVAWLLLLLASTLSTVRFPHEVLTAAQSFGLNRKNQTGKPEIRTLKDADGLTAEQRAEGLPAIWHEWTRSGLLRSSPDC